jgi:hypothetical protein
MPIQRLAATLILMLFCSSLNAQTPSQMTVTGKLVHVMAIGGESTGWAIQLESQTTIDSKQVDFIEVDYSESKKLKELADKRVKAKGTLSHRHGVETGDRPVLDISSIKEAKPPK